MRSETGNRNDRNHLPLTGNMNMNRVSAVRTSAGGIGVLSWRKTSVSDVQSRSETSLTTADIAVCSGEETTKKKEVSRAGKSAVLISFADKLLLLFQILLFAAFLRLPLQSQPAGLGYNNLRRLNQMEKQSHRSVSCRNEGFSQVKFHLRVSVTGNHTPLSTVIQMMNELRRFSFLFGHQMNIHQQKKKL